MYDVVDESEISSGRVFRGLVVQNTPAAFSATTLVPLSTGGVEVAPFASSVNVTLSFPLSSVFSQTVRKPRTRPLQLVAALIGLTAIFNSLKSLVDAWDGVCRCCCKTSEPAAPSLVFEATGAAASARAPASPASPSTMHGNPLFAATQRGGPKV